MTGLSSTAAAPALPAGFDRIREQITSLLIEFLNDKEEQARAAGLHAEVPAIVRDFIAAGGKRFRPLLCLAGWQAAGGSGAPEMVLRTAAALEMYQAFALIHDDIIDNSATRRSQPTVHRELAARHTGAEAEHFGASAALLVGNMAFIWSDELVTGAAVGPGQRVAVARLLCAMREEMHYGQYLDLLTGLGPLDDAQAPLKVTRYKTSKYTVERPLQIGATLAGADDHLLDLLSRFALPLGDAFQFRDDLLGLFGDPEATGKPVLDDLREGKRTLLLALAAANADAGQRKVLDELVGNPELDEPDARRVRAIVTATGAVTKVENVIADHYAKAMGVLADAPVSDSARETLKSLAGLIVVRTS